MKPKNQFAILPIIGLVTLTLAIIPASAATILVGDHSFEGSKLLTSWPGGTANANESIGLPASGYTYWQNGSPSAGLGFAFDGTTFYTSDVTDGDIFAFTNTNGYAYQTLSTVLLPDTTYTLTVAVGNRKSANFPGYGIELWAGATKMAFTNGAANSITDNSWTDVVASFTSASSVTAGQALQIRLVGSGTQINFDNVRLDGTSIIPEPGTALLGGLGMLVLLRRRR